MRRILILQYIGLGDAIVNAPLVKSILDGIKVSKVFISSNDMWSFLKLLVDKDNKLHFLPPNYRSLDLIDDLDTFIKANKISDIISFRRDITKDCSFWERYQKTISENGVNYYCYENQLSYEKYVLKNFYQTAYELTIAAGDFSPPKTMRGWLSGIYNYTYYSNRPIIVYLGASTINKRLPSYLWVKIFQDLTDNHENITIISSKSRAEQLYENQIFSKLKINGNINITNPTSFDDIIKILQFSKGLISGDTYIIHLAASLNMPIFGIYLSTDSNIYGPDGYNNFIYQNAGYYKCRLKNVWGNCNGWMECKSLRCFQDIDYIKLRQSMMEWIKSNNR